jgi:peptide chain release factor 1
VRASEAPDARTGHQFLSIEFDGQGAEKLQNEAGGHRIQRVPKSEHKGRVHSSTVTVACLGGTKAADTPFDHRQPNDFSVEWYSGSGAGGQHRNKHQNSARITHLPTGLIRQAQTRSRENSHQAAMAEILEELDKQAALSAQGA